MGPLTNRLRKPLLALAPVAIVLSFFLRATGNQQPQPVSTSTPRTQLVFLGTGTPKPDPERSGPATAIVVNGAPYLVDFGPGVIRRAAAAKEKGVAALDETKLHAVFVTHLHSDHTAGYPDLILTSWVRGRTEPLEVFGPRGIKAMTDHVLEAWKEDIQIRTKGKEQENDTGWRVNAHEIQPGVVYKDSNVTVKAFLVPHGDWPQAFGYRFETPDRTIVISGDTAPAQSIIDNCNGCDILVHEAYTLASREGISEKWLKYSLAYHTSTKELAEIAAKAKPKLLIIYHRANPGRGPGDTEEQLLKEMHAMYNGPVAAAHDLDIY